MSTSTTAADWQSPAIPPTIRRPWRVFEEDLEDKLADVSAQGLPVDPLVRDQLGKVQARGAQAAYLTLPEDEQRNYVEVSLMELGAYVCWRRKQALHKSCGDDLDGYYAAWDALDCDMKGEFVPEDPRAVLAEDGIWAPLLADGPPACGPRTMVVNGESTLAGDTTATATDARHQNLVAVPAGKLIAHGPSATPGLKASPLPEPRMPKIVKQEEVKSPRLTAQTVPAAGAGQKSRSPQTAAQLPKREREEMSENQRRSPKVNAPPDANDIVGAPNTPSVAQSEGGSPKDHTEVAAKRIALEKAAAAKVLEAAVSKVLPQQKHSPTLSTQPLSEGRGSGRERGARCRRMEGAGGSAGLPASQSSLVGGDRPRRLCRLSPSVLTSEQAAASTSAACQEHSQGGADSIRVHQVNGKRQRHASQHCQPSKRKLAPENLCPEALDAICSVCGAGEAADHNDLALCDMCDKGFHQQCHNPPVAFFGNPDDQWFCGSCTMELARQRGLRLAIGDFAWVVVPGDAQPWPARVLRIDFSSLADPRPYWVQFFDTGPNTGSWVSEGHVSPWSEGPAFGDIREARRKLAVRLAEADGAPPLNPNVQQAPVKPLPAFSRSAIPGCPTTVAHATAPSSRRRNETVTNSALMRKVDEIREQIEASQKRQRLLEEEIDKARSGAASQQ